MKWMRRLAWAGGVLVGVCAGQVRGLRDRARQAQHGRVVRDSLDKVAQALTDRPALQMTVTGVSDPAAERDELLTAVYKDTDIPNKPRNLVGLAKSLPAAEMEALLKSTIEVMPDAMRQLALQRGLAVRDALVAKGLPSERLFLAAPKVRAAADAASWLPSAKLSLTSD